MEIKFDDRKIKMYKEIYCQTRQIQESTESVVPDTDDDIGKIALTHSTVLLKSKDITARGVLISGEAIASLMYITESQDKVSFVKLSKSFSMEYEIPGIEADAAACIKLGILSADARVINPRKVAVNFCISGELSCYVVDELSLESALPVHAQEKLHAKYDNSELNIISSVCEKTFSINEQFVFPGGKPKPSRFVSSKTEFMVSDTQLIGTKVIVKGTVEASVCYLSDEVNYPVKTEFSTAFSQIVDIGELELDGCTASIELTAAYYDIADSINGDKLLDMELHAVMQLVCRSSREILYISDVYSNCYPTTCNVERYSIDVLSDSRVLKISGDERTNVMDDCADVLSIFAAISRVSQEQSTIKAFMNIDLVYKTQSGQLSSVRRNMTLEGETGLRDCRLSHVRLSDTYFRPDGQYLDARISLEIGCYCSREHEFGRVVSVELDEEEAISLEDYPSISLVRCSGESLWELAKSYHSCVEKIQAFNDVDGDLSGRMLLIPKSL